MHKPIELLFLGTGTSAGVPMIGCHCDVCSSPDPRDKRSRCSVVIRYEGHAILVDTAPELRLQAVAHGVDRIDAVVFTHAHADHIMGLDDIRRFNSLKGGPLDVWADARTMQTIQQCFAYAFREPKAEWKLFRPHLHSRLIEGPFHLFGRQWLPIRLIHGDTEVLGFRIDDLAYCTDASEIPPESMELLRGLDVLVLDGLQERKHPTHLTIAEALAVVAELKPRQTWLTHISHQVRHAVIESALPPGVNLAYDGLRVHSVAARS
ncbi:MAG: MBL fold metallo-hydrolase [Phycisphaerales bacterium]|nr:MBL fold metallo-hydrolase [Phycisphaerales bacterium]